MARLTFENLPEVFVSDAQHAPFISREVKKGRIRKLASRLYTTNLKEPAERLVQRHLWSIVAAFYHWCANCRSHSPRE